MNLPTKFGTNEIAQIICNDCHKKLYGLAFNVEIYRDKKALGWATAHCSCSAWEFEIQFDKIVKIKQTKAATHPTIITDRGLTK